MVTSALLHFHSIETNTYTRTRTHQWHGIIKICAASIPAVPPGWWSLCAGPVEASMLSFRVTKQVVLGCRSPLWLAMLAEMALIFLCDLLSMEYDNVDNSKEDDKAKDDSGYCKPADERRHVHLGQQALGGRGRGAAAGTAAQAPGVRGWVRRAGAGSVYLVGQLSGVLTAGGAVQREGHCASASVQGCEEDWQSCEHGVDDCSVVCAGALRGPCYHGKFGFNDPERSRVAWVRTSFTNCPASF